MVSGESAGAAVERWGNHWRSQAEGQIGEEKSQIFGDAVTQPKDLK